jgi:serine/threonine protein kinase
MFLNDHSATLYTNQKRFFLTLFLFCTHIQSDIFAIGITIIEMLENKPPYKSLMSPTSYSADFHDFVGKCLAARPEGRLPAIELLKVSLCCLSVSYKND